MLARILYAAAAVLALLAILGLLKVFVVGVGWIGLAIAAVVCYIIARVVVDHPTRL
jgi:predicted DNA-binding transcriptional regulator